MHTFYNKYRVFFIKFIRQNSTLFFILIMKRKELLYLLNQSFTHQSVNVDVIDVIFIHIIIELLTTLVLLMHHVI